MRRPGTAKHHEHKIMMLIAEHGLMIKEIAFLVDLEESTVKHYVKRIKVRLKVRNHTQIAIHVWKQRVAKYEKICGSQDNPAGRNGGNPPQETGPQYLGIRSKIGPGNV